MRRHTHHTFPPGIPNSRFQTRADGYRANF
jgi:hypothetical protein